MILVVYGAVACGCVAPMVQLWQAGVVNGGSIQGLVGVALFEAVVVPIVWVGLSLVLVRRGAWRDTVVLALMLCSVLAALGTATWVFVAVVIPAFRRSGLSPVSLAGVGALALHALLIVGLAGAGLFLTTRLVRRSKSRGVSAGREHRILGSGAQFLDVGP
jgi:hypothetical protein